MKLYRYNEVPTKTIRRTYRNTGWRAIGAAALFMGIITAYVALPKSGPTNPVLIAVPGLLTFFLGGLMLYRYRVGAHQQNWLLRESEAGLYVNLRATHNLHYPETQPCVLFIPKDEIGAIGQTVETRILPDRNGPSTYHWSYIDLYLTHDDTGEVAARLHAERRLDTRKRSGSYTVRVVDPPAIRLLWDWVRPAEDAALRELAEHWPVAPDQKITHEPWDKLDDTTKEQVIAELWEQGHLLEAHRAARMHHGISGAKAWQRLDDLA